jgi:heme exporter protein D
MLFWHLSGSALTIWLSRNWTTEQIVCKALEIKEKQKTALNQLIQQKARAERAW